MDRIQPIEKANIATRVYTEVREALISGAFLPDERIRIQEMADRFGTSATPVREALLRLVSERALVMEAAKSINVPPLEEARYLELRTIRLALEPLAVQLAVPHIGKKELAELVEADKRYREAGKHLDPTQRMLHNRRFHFGIYNRCGLPTLQAIIENLWASMGPVLKAFFLHNRDRSFVDPDHHVMILDALKKKDPEAAAAGIREDILGASPSILSFLQDVQEAQTEAVK